jgi:p-aminobenzoyl-glutamate transporter AbgT
MIDNVNKVALGKAAVDTATATAASIGVLTFLGVTLANWVYILTIIWFLILIIKFIKDDIVIPIINHNHKEKE